MDATHSHASLPLDSTSYCRIDPLVLPGDEQCTECGMRVTGPLAGMRATLADGSVIRLVGYLPTICEDCRKAWLTSQVGE